MIATHICELGEVASFVRGLTFKPTDVVPLGSPDSVACMRTKNVQAEIDLTDVLAVPAKFVKRKDQYIDEGDILVSSANSWNLVGKCCWVPRLPWTTSFGGFISALRADRERIDPRYLYHWLSTDRTQATLRSFGQQTTNISNLNIERTLSLKFPLPSLTEQRRIAAILDAAEALRAKRRAALAKLDTLTQSIFLEMFGDVDVVRTWQDGSRVYSVAEIAAHQRHACVGGPFGSDLTQSHYVDGPGVPVLRGQNLASSDGTLIEEGYVYVSDNKAEELSANQARRGDVVVSQRGARLAGQVAYISDNSTFDRYVVSQRQMKITPNLDLVTPFYLVQYFRTPKAIAMMESRTISTGVPHINLGILRQFPVLVPPIKLQFVFGDRAKKVAAVRNTYIKSLRKLDGLFVGLQHRAFCGEL